MQKIIESLVIVILFVSVLAVTGALIIVAQQLTKSDEGCLWQVTEERSEFDG